MLNNNDEGHSKKTYYVSVQAGQMLEDSESAAYELIIEADDEQRSRLEELFQELSSMDEYQIGQYAWSRYAATSDAEINAGYDYLLHRIYSLLYDCGTESTRQHIESMGIL